MFGKQLNELNYGGFSISIRIHLVTSTWPYASPHRLLNRYFEIRVYNISLSMLSDSTSISK